MERRERKPDGYWYVRENVIEESKKFKTIHEFSVFCRAGFRMAIINDWLKDCGFNEPDRIEELKKYIVTEETCKKAASKYSSASEFRNNSDHEYRYAVQHNLMDDLGFVTGTPRSEVYCVYLYEDPKNKYAYAGLSNDMKRRDNEHRRPKNNDAVYRHFKEFGLEIPQPIIVKSGLTKKEAKTEEENLVNSILEKGWNKINIAKTGSTGGIILKWDYDACKELSNECDTPTEFLSASRNAYEISKEKGWIYEFYPDFKKRHFYTYEECKQYASVCRSKTDLRRLCHGAYMKALKNGWLDDFDFIPKGEAFAISNTKWHYDNCKEEAAKYPNITAFKKGSRGAWGASMKNGWDEEFFPRKKNTRKPLSIETKIKISDGVRKTCSSKKAA